MSESYLAFLLIHEALHLLVASPLLWVALQRRDLKIGVAVLAGTFAVDLDHLFPLVGLPWGEAFSYLVRFELFAGQTCPFLPGHGLELAVLLIGAGWAFKERGRFLVYGGWALALHLGLDVASYIGFGLHPSYYFYLGWVLETSCSGW